MAKHVVIRFNVHTWLQQPGGTETVERNKGDEDVVPQGYANELVSCGLATLVGCEDDIPTIATFEEALEDVSS